MRTHMKAGGGSISDVRKTLNEAQDLYLNLMQHGNYTPGHQPVHDDARSRLHAMQAQVKALTDKVGLFLVIPTPLPLKGMVEAHVGLVNARTLTRPVLQIPLL